MVLSQDLNTSDENSLRVQHIGTHVILEDKNFKHLLELEYDQLKVTPEKVLFVEISASI